MMAGISLGDEISRGEFSEMLDESNIYSSQNN